MGKVAIIQYQAALAITGTWQGSNCTELYEELGWQSLSDRRMSRRILQIHKIRRTLEYLRDKLPPNRRLFLPTIFRNIQCRTNRYSNSFFPDAIASRNNMISHFEHFPTFDNLKKLMLSLIRPEAKLMAYTTRMVFVTFSN